MAHLAAPVPVALDPEVNWNLTNAEIEALAEVAICRRLDAIKVVRDTMRQHAQTRGKCDSKNKAGWTL